METNCIFITSNFVIHPQVLICSVFKTASLSPYWFEIKFSMSSFFYFCTFAINLWHRKFVTADATAVFVNNQHGIQRQGQDFDKKNTYKPSAYTVARVEDLKSVYKNAICLHFLVYLLNICRFVAKVRWIMSMHFVANFIGFPAVKVLKIG